MPKLNMVQAINLAIAEEMARDDSVVVLGEDVGRDGGVFRVTDGLLDKFGESRVIDAPIAESGIIGTAVGMCFGGLKPVVEIQFSGFGFIAYAQIEGQGARYRSRTQGQRHCPLVVRMPYGGKVRAFEHHSESREATFAHTPGLKVVIPSTPRNARALMTAAIRDPDCVVFMEPKHSYRAFKEEMTDEPDAIEIGQANIVKPGDNLTLIGWGAMMPYVQKAAAEVEEKRGISIEIIDLLTMAPLDADTVTESVKKTGRCVIVQEAPKTLGMASELIALINDHALMHLEAPVRRLASPDVITPYFARENLYFPSQNRIRLAVEETLDFS